MNSLSFSQMTNESIRTPHFFFSVVNRGEYSKLRLLLICHDSNIFFLVLFSRVNSVSLERHSTLNSNSKATETEYRMRRKTRASHRKLQKDWRDCEFRRNVYTAFFHDNFVPNVRTACAAAHWRSATVRDAFASSAAMLHSLDTFGCGTATSQRCIPTNNVRVFASDRNAMRFTWRSLLENKRNFVQRWSSFCFRVWLCIHDSARPSKCKWSLLTSDNKWNNQLIHFRLKMKSGNRRNDDDCCRRHTN